MWRRAISGLIHTYCFRRKFHRQSRFRQKEALLILAGDLLLAAFALYVFMGAAYALHFCTKVAGMVNVRARFASPMFRLFLAPGAILLWPMLRSLERSGRLFFSEDSRQVFDKGRGSSQDAAAGATRQGGSGGEGAV